VIIDGPPLLPVATRRFSSLASASAPSVVVRPGQRRSAQIDRALAALERSMPTCMAWCSHGAQESGGFGTYGEYHYSDVPSDHKLRRLAACADTASYGSEEVVLAPSEKPRLATARATEVPLGHWAAVP